MCKNSCFLLLIVKSFFFECDLSFTNNIFLHVGSKKEMQQLKAKLARLTALLTTIDDDDQVNYKFSPIIDFPINSVKELKEFDSRIKGSPAEKAKLVCFFLVKAIFC